MKNKFLIIFLSLSFFLPNKLFSENISITAKNISIDKNDNSTIFENEVFVVK